MLHQSEIDTTKKISEFVANFGDSRVDMSCSAGPRIEQYVGASLPVLVYIVQESIVHEKKECFICTQNFLSKTLYDLK